MIRGGGGTGRGAGFGGSTARGTDLAGIVVGNDAANGGENLLHGWFL